MRCGSLIVLVIADSIGHETVVVAVFSTWPGGFIVPPSFLGRGWRCPICLPAGRYGLARYLVGVHIVVGHDVYGTSSASF
jgi:hypothetical protein